MSGHVHDVDPKERQPVTRQPAARRPVIEGAPLTEGAPLDSAVRENMEARFRFDFSSVRVHASSRDAAAADEINAAAYTVGDHVVFGHGAYRPGTAEGDRVLAHELTHVVQNARFGPGTAEISHPGDAAEREAAAVAAGGDPEVRQALSAGVARDTPPPAPPPNVVPQNAPPVFNVFEEPSATKSAADAAKAFDKYLKLVPADQERARRWSLSTGRLRLVLETLGPARSADPKYAGAVHDLLRWIEETETRKTTGKSDADIARTQSGFIKEKSSGSAPPGWGGTTTTRWAGLLPGAKTSWTDRGNKAIAAMVAHAKTAAPELALTTASFALEFDAVDQVSKGALATVGSKPGENVHVGFEFVVTVEVNPAYALSTVVHELKGHPMYNEKGGTKPNYAGKLYQDAAALVPAAKDIDRSGNETFNYWPTEIYSLLKEIPYWNAVTPADEKKVLNLPGGGKSNAARLNYDPRGAIRSLLGEMRTHWEPSLVNGIVRGFYKRVQADPSVKKVSVTEFETIIKAVFKAADAAVILK